MFLRKNNGIDKLEDYIFQRMASSGIYGLSIATIKDSEIHYQRGFGFRDFIRGTSATPRTTYCIGSVTKPFTSLAIMQLRDRGLLSIEDPIEEHLPIQFRAMGEPILIKHLLSHTSGLAALGYAEATLSAVSDMSEIWLPICSPQDLFIFIQGAEEWSISKPGQRYAYLNEGYILLGSVIEKVSGVSYADYVKQNILNPLGMERSTFLEEDVLKDTDVATPYITSQNGERIATRYPFGQMISDGGLMSNAEDMVKFVRLYLSENSGVINPSTIKEIITPKIRTTEDPIEGSNYTHYGYGIRIKSDFFRHDLVYHSGSVFGSSAYIGLVPDEKVGVVIMASGGYFLEDMGEYALALLLEKNPMDIVYFKRTKILDSLTGTYNTFRNTANYKVTRSGGILQLEIAYAHRTYTTPLIPVDIEGEVKQFKVYSIDSTTPLQFIQEGNTTYMLYERNKAKKVNGL